MNEEQFIKSVEGANPQLVGRKLSIHWDTVESLMRKAYRAGKDEAIEPIRKANESIPDFMKGLFR